MAAADPERWIVVDAAGDAATVAARVRAALGELRAHDGARCGTASSASRRRSPRCRRQLAAPVHAYLFVGPPGSTKHEAARAFAASLLTGADEPDQRDARLAPARRAPRRPRGRAHRAGDLRRAGPRDRPRHVAGAGRGRPQDRRPARVPPPDGRGRGAAAQDDRGATAVDDVRRARRLRAARADHDRLALRAHRVPVDPRRRPRRSPARRGRGRRRRRRHRRGRRRRPHPGAHPRHRPRPRRAPPGVRRPSRRASTARAPP